MRSPTASIAAARRIGLACALLLAVRAPHAVAAGDGPDFVTAPPTVQSLAVQLIDPPQARLLVEYAPDARLPPELPLTLGRQVVVLRDTGEAGDERARDRTYTGTFTLDVRALERQWRMRSDLTQRERTVPVFVGREVVGQHLIEPITPAALGQRLAGGAPVLLAKYGVCSTQPIDWRKSLLITNTKVVRNSKRTYDPCRKVKGKPTGVWSVPYLIREAAGGSTATDATVSLFIKNWLEQWTTAQTVNGRTVPARAKMQELIIDPWKAASTAAGVDFDPAKAPFRLLAIVNRVDKADSLIYGLSSAPDPASGGELRFVFGALSKDCVPLDFTVILEYAVNRTDCEGIAAWANDWIALSQLAFGKTYNETLEALTETIVKFGSAPLRANKSWLSQVRTNELSLDNPAGGSVWDMREFRLNDKNELMLDTVKETPDGSLNGSTRLRDYVNANTTAIEADQYKVPPDHPTGQPFLAGQALAKPTPGVWNAPGITSAKARFVFSRNTCNGCHARETDTDSTHINPSVTPGSAGQLSAFLTGGTVTDPVDGSTHTFGDLDRRVGQLSNAATLDCLCQLYNTTLTEPH
jgi:hypothetical protein